MNKKWVLTLSICLFLILVGGAMFKYFRKSEPEVITEAGAWISLPEPAQDGQAPIESAFSIHKLSANTHLIP